jgi:leucyl aminopeptidase
MSTDADQAGRRGPILSVGRTAAAEAVGPLDVLAVPVVEGSNGPELAAGCPSRLVVTEGELSLTVDDRRAAAARFSGSVGETLLVGPAGPGPLVCLLGLGRPEAAPQPVTLCRAVAAAVRTAGPGRLGLVVPGPAPADAAPATGSEPDRTGPGPAGALGRAAAEGAVLASYRFTAHRSELGRRGRPASRPEGPAEVVFLVPDGVDDVSFATGVHQGRRAAQAVWFARDLVNEPPSSMTPRRLAEAAVAELGQAAGVRVEVWDDQRITAEGLGGLLGVARGSAEPPRLVWATYEPADPAVVDGRVPHLVLVGKGITFDSGGLSLKTPAGMTTMKTDMSGAAAVLGAISACGDLGVRVRVTALAPITENMPGGAALKPGDVLRARNGKTIEVLNTDAEGRLILADALSLAVEQQPDAIVDIATLTGACVVALGNRIGGLFASDADLRRQVEAAAESVGEALWALPLPDEYRSHIDSEVADMKNVGKDGQAGAIAAAMLLAEFVGDVPWVHLDIAGPARSDEDAGVLTKGGTGFGVRTLLRLAETFAPAAATTS